MLHRCKCTSSIQYLEYEQNDTNVTVKMKLVILAFAALSAALVNSYDAEKAIEERTSKYRAACKRYNDPRLPEYQVLFGSKLHLYKIPRNVDKRVFVCAPLKVGSSAFQMLFRRLYFQDMLRMGKEDFDAAMAAVGSSDEEQEKFFRESTR